MIQITLFIIELYSKYVKYNKILNLNDNKQNDIHLIFGFRGYGVHNSGYINIRWCAEYLNFQIKYLHQFQKPGEQLGL